jgi:hypothetical protein
MLASITPLGERSRGFSWRVTAAAFAVGSVGAGGFVGAAVGTLGSLLPGGLTWRGLGLAGVLAITVAFDATPLRRRLPSSRRQVNEDWLARYRGWVYGFGFGAQLGVGVATIVTSAAVYAAAATALLCANPMIGALIGATFGALRALSLLPAGAVHDVGSLGLLHRRLGTAEADVRRAVSALELALLMAVVVILVWRA